jgi:hypothetical protein
MKKIPLITITPTIKVQILHSLASQKAISQQHITFFKGGPTDLSQQEKEHPTASKIHATLDSCPL